MALNHLIFQLIILIIYKHDNQTNSALKTTIIHLKLSQHQTANPWINEYKLTNTAPQDY